MFKELAQTKIEQILILENQVSDSSIQIMSLTRENMSLRDENLLYKEQINEKLKSYSRLFKSANLLSQIKQIKEDMKT